MPKIEAVQSEFDNSILTDPSQVAKAHIHEYPGFPEGDLPKEFFGKEKDIKAIVKAALKDVVVVETWLPGAEESVRYTLTKEAFDALSKTAMEDVMKNAATVEPQKEEKKKRNGKEQDYDYKKMEHSGRPHRGTATEQEKQNVRRNLNLINAQLVLNGERTIDPDDPTFIKRFEFDKMCNRDQFIPNEKQIAEGLLPYPPIEGWTPPAKSDEKGSEQESLV